jgi:CRISPR system Cascade subunit CasD
LERGDTELERLDRELRFGVRVDRPGVISTDYHTVTGYHRTAAGEFKHSGGTSKNLSKAREHGESTIVSPRDYLHDAAFLVALAGPAALLERLDIALEAPRWPLFLGRKSCPAACSIRWEKREQYGGLEDALQKAEWLAPRSRKERRKIIEGQTLEAWFESEDGKDAGNSKLRQDAVRLNPLRMYEFRQATRLPVERDVLTCRIW